MFFLVFPQNLLTTSGLCTYFHVSNQHYIDRICKTAYQPMHRDCSALYFGVSKDFVLYLLIFDKLTFFGEGDVSECIRGLCFPPILLQHLATFFTNSGANCCLTSGMFVKVGQVVNQSVKNQ